MLILGRKPGDTILIEGGIRIVVVSCDRGGVRLGVEAPADLKILRGEIAEQVAEANRRATAGTDAAAWLAAVGGPVSASPARSGATAP
jgi:carbon storage regulator